MDYNERAKNTPYNIENEITSFKEKTDEKWELRKKHNQSIIMAERRKRIIQLSQNNEKENSISDNLLDNEINLNNKSLLNENDLLIKLPPLNNISNNINEILKYLSSDNIDENKWILYSLRIYFQQYKIPYYEYSILFDNNIHKYFEKLFNKYKNDFIIINEIFFIITNFFDNDNIINKYPKKYFQYFLDDNYFLIYQKYIILKDDETINSILILLRNIIVRKSDLINYIYNNRKQLFYNLVDYFKENQMTSGETVKNFIFFMSVIFQDIKDNYISDFILFNNILDTIFMIYRNINSQKKIDFQIIKHIIYIFKNALNFKIKDENENDDYFVLNYLFDVINKNIPNFVSLFCESLLQNYNYYYNDISLLIISLELLCDITDNARVYQIQLLIKYNIFNILNNILYFINIYNYNNILLIISKVLIISNNIINSSRQISKIFINSEIFNSLIKFFSSYLNDDKIGNIFIDTFQLLLNYNDKEIADNLNKRGIIKDGIFNSLQYLNINKIKMDIILKKCKIISDYLNIMYDPNKNNNGFNKEDYLLGYKFKEMIEMNHLNIPEDYIETILHLDYMNSFETQFE